MSKYAGTKTEANLRAAFAGESQARNQYTFFASVAKKEGYEQMAALFLKTAENEKEHAKLWLKELSGIGDTPHGDNTAVSLLTWDNGELRVEYRDDNSHLTERGLSTFARQSWWRSAKMVDPGEDYVPLPEELRRRFHVPNGGEAIGIGSHN